VRELEGKGAVVTGGGSGIGAALGRHLAGEGMRVALADIDVESCEAVAGAIRGGGGQAEGFPVDVTDSASLLRLAAEVEEQMGGCSLLCANAGVLQMGRLDSRSEEDWEWCLSVNLLGTIRSVRAFLPQMRRQEGGKHVVITSSMAGLLAAGPAKGVYNTSKHAQMAYGETLRAELADEGIGVSLLLPAGTESRIAESARNRPSRLGTTEITEEDMQTLAAALGDEGVATISAEEAVRNVARGIRENAAWIVTHTSQRALIEGRFEAILAAFDRAEE